MKTITLKQDSRDSHAYMHFGQVTEFLPELNLDSVLYDEVQPIGDIKCTCYTTCNIAEDEDKVYYDIDNLASRVHFTSSGADPREPLGEAVKNGLKRKDTEEIVKHWSSYWRADTGMHDSFDNVRSIMQLINCPVGCGTYWYANWPSGDVLPVGETPVSGHMYEIEGWKQINGEPYFIIEAWIGRKLYMSRQVFNEALKPYGMQTWVLSTSDRDEKRQKTILETIKDLCVNAIILLKKLLVLKQTVVVQPVSSPTVDTYQEVKEAVQPKRDLIEEFCLAIRDYEGKPGDRNYRNNNPGNCRDIHGNFLVFSTYEVGFAYLRNYVERACTGKHPAYKPDFTITQFFRVYSPSSDNNNPDAYAIWVCSKVGILTTMKIKDLLN